MPSFVSVIVPAYNAEGTIEQCVQSIFHQTLQPQEVILVDDSSTDRTLQKMEAMPCKLLRMDKRRGAGSARNAGAREARGDILVFVDADIQLDPRSLEKILRGISQVGVDVVSALYTKDLPETFNYYNHFQNLLCIYRNCKLSKTAPITFSFFCAMKKEVFNKLGGYDPIIPSYEDVEIGHRLGQNGYHTLLDDGFDVIHLKFYDHGSLVREYFRKISTAIAYAFRDGLGGFYKKISSDNCPLHLKISGIATFLCLVTVFVLPWGPWPLAVSLGIYLAAVSPLVLFFIKRRGLLFGLTACLLCFEIFLVSFFAALYGTLNSKKCLKF
jgi:glycosyltransferase involved in cell wall biosynthesis